MWRHFERLGRSPWRVDASECGIFAVVSNPAGHGAENVAEDARGRSDLDGFSTQDTGNSRSLPHDRREAFWDDHTGRMLVIRCPERTVRGQRAISAVMPLDSECR